jgi:hypothetical protein
MEHLIYVFITEDNVDVYPNLRQLADKNPQVPYYSICKLLKTTSMIKRDTFTIAVKRLKYNTKRGFGKKKNQEDF